MEIIYRKGWEPKQKRSALDEAGRKYCGKCNTWKPLSEFYLSGKYWVKIDGVWWGKPQLPCTECRKEYARGKAHESDLGIPPEGANADPVATFYKQRAREGVPAIREAQVTEVLPSGRYATDAELLQPAVTYDILVKEMLPYKDVTIADVERFKELRPNDVPE